MTQTVDDLIAERAQVEPGLSSGFFVSVSLHVLATGLLILAPVLFPKAPPQIPPLGHFVPLPPGGRGTPDPAPPAADTSAAESAVAPPVTAPPAPPVTAPPKPVIAQPPVDKPKKGLPPPNEKKKPPKATPPPAPAPGSGSRTAGGAPTRTPGVTPGATGNMPQTPGIQLAPDGPGVPSGTDPFGDWYLASVQRKIWLLWLQQSKPAGHPEIKVSFTILADGSVTDVQVLQGSGNVSLDFSARRAIQSAGPFSPLPKHYGISRKTIQAIFRPT